MNIKFRTLSGVAAATLTILPAGVMVLAPISPVIAQSTGEVTVLSIGRGQQINLPEAVTDVFIANPAVADVDVKSPRQLYIFGKGQGETTIYATNAQGRTVYQATIRVGGNIDSIDQMLAITMPDSKISVSTMNGIVLLTGTVQNPSDAAEAAGIGANLCRERHQSCVPHQNRNAIASEPARSLCRGEPHFGQRNWRQPGDARSIERASNSARFVGAAVRWQISDYDTTGLPVLDASSLYGLPAGTISLPFDPVKGQFVGGGSQNINSIPSNPASMITMAASLFGLGHWCGV